MKLPLCYYTDEADIESSEPRANAFFDLIFAKDRKVLASLCSRDTCLIIRKVPVIAIKEGSADMEDIGETELQLPENST